MARVETFETAAAELGFEWLAGERLARGSPDEDEELEPDESGETGQIYLTMPTPQGLKALLAKWARYKQGKPSQGPNESALWALFGYLRDLRAYSVQDRIDSSVIRHIEALLQKDPGRPVLIEIDLWFRATARQRELAQAALVDLLQLDSAELLDAVTIEEIQYQAVLIRAPVSVAYEISQRHGRLANANEVMSIRTQSVSEEPVPLSANITPMASAALSVVEGPCVTGIIDGYPISEHAKLAGRLVIAEADVTAAQAPVAVRYHGTAMASLVVHGDIESASPALASKVAVVPVLAAVAGGNRETTPFDKLPVGVIHRAVRALLAGTADGQVKKGDITLINHSLCDSSYPFVGRPSPWAALLDQMAFEHDLLFVVSAGNVSHGFELDGFTSEAEALAADDATRLAAILLGMEKARRHRNLLSPAESLNALTVGALHADGASGFPSGLIDPFPDHAMANLCSAVGPGVNRSIKPDVVEAGGRLSAVTFNTPQGIMMRGVVNPNIGQRVAAPHPLGDLAHEARTVGTSNATALVTRAGAQIAAAVSDLYSTDADPWHRRRTRAVILKALIAHGCRWDHVAELLDGVFPPEGTARWSRRRDAIAAFLGHGRPNVDIVSGTENRATLLADDEIGHGKLHEYRIPIPDAILTSRDIRRIVVTLAWSTPVSVTTSAYRGFSLNVVAADGTTKLWSRVGRTFQANGLASERGTLIHNVYEGNTRTTFSDPKGLFIAVQARALSKRFEDLTVPYALAVTIELASSQKTSLYIDVRDAIRNRARVANRVQQRL